MMVYPYKHELIHDALTINSSISGLASSNFTRLYGSKDSLHFNAVTARMGNYDKIVLDPDMHIQYHLSGYGITAEESIQRLLGETIERYALLMTNALFKNRIVQTSLSSLQKQKKRVVSLQYLQHFTDEQGVIFNHYFPSKLHNVTEDSIIEWIPLCSFTDQEDIYIPFSLFKLGKKDDDNFLFGMSTGTATHGSYKKALTHSLVEYFQLHTFNAIWYLREKMP